MAKIGFWQLLLDDKLSYWEAQRINEAYDAADQAQAAAHIVGVRTDQRLAMMSREIVMLRTALTVLTRTLKDTNVIDERLLDARLEAAMEEAFPPPPPPDSPFPTGPIKTTCMRCRQQVLASTTNMTADGPMCDRCPKPAAI